MLYKDWRRINANAQLLNKLKHTQENLNFLINRPSQNYYVQVTKKNVLMSAKTIRHRSLLRRILINKKYL